MSKRAGPALDAFKDLVFPEGYTPGAGKRKVCILPKIINPFPAVHNNYHLLSHLLIYFGSLYCKQY